MKALICDICGKQIKEHGTHDNNETYGQLILRNTYQPNKNPIADLCEDCAAFALKIVLDLKVDMAKKTRGK